jgi:predicted RNase H-like nuclease (RuvC/YqgF family)
MFDWQPVLAVFIAGAGLFAADRSSDARADKRGDELKRELAEIRARMDRNTELTNAGIDRIADAQNNLHNVLGEHKGKIEMLEEALTRRSLLLVKANGLSIRVEFAVSRCIWLLFVISLGHSFVLNSALRQMQRLA